MERLGFFFGHIFSQFSSFFTLFDWNGNSHFQWAVFLEYTWKLMQQGNAFLTFFGSKWLESATEYIVYVLQHVVMMAKVC
jgi:hypothetical protein